MPTHSSAPWFTFSTGKCHKKMAVIRFWVPVYPPSPIPVQVQHLEFWTLVKSLHLLSNALAGIQAWPNGSRPDREAQMEPLARDLALKAARRLQRQPQAS